MRAARSIACGATVHSTATAAVRHNQACVVKPLAPQAGAALLHGCSSSSMGTCGASHSHQHRLLARLQRRPRASPLCAAPAVGAAGTSTAPSPIYSRPDLYDLAFSYRDFDQEVNFLLNIYDLHAGTGTTPSSVLELACGPARHLLGLSKAGVQHTIGLDMSEDMLAYARKLVASSSPARKGSQPAVNDIDVQLVKGDMTNFELQQKNLDMVCCLLGSFSHLLENSQAISCFRMVDEHLRPGGLFVLELAHPGDLFDGTLIIGDGGKEVWEVPLPKGLPNGDRKTPSGSKATKLFVEWGDEFDQFNPVTQVLDRTISFNVLRGEQVIDSVEEVVQYRQFTVRELELMAAMTGFEFVGLYGEMDVNVGLDDEGAYRMVVVCRKAKAGTA